MAVNESIRKMAIKILYGLGEVNRSNDQQPAEYDCTYKGYGLEIVAGHLPSKIDPEKNRFLSDIEIKDQNLKVFDSKKGKYVPGLWEDVLLNIYHKLPILMEEKEREDQRKKHAKELFDKTLKKISSGRIGNEIEIIKNKEYGEDNEITKEFIKVFKGQSLVFHMEKEKLKEYELKSYIPGEWEEEIKDYISEIEQERKVTKIKETNKPYKLIKTLK